MNPVKKIIELDNIKYGAFIKKIIKQNLINITDIVISTEQEDCQYATDYKIIINGINIAVRRRGLQYLKYGDITIRAKTKYNHKTEFDKIKDGYGDFYLYFWADDIQYFYIFVDLKIVRESNILNNTYQIRWNNDGTGFVAIKIKELFENNCIIDYCLPKKAS